MGTLVPGDNITPAGPGGPPRRFRRGAAHPIQPPAYANMPASNTMLLTALPTTTTMNDPDPQSFGNQGPSPGRLRRRAGHAKGEPQNPEENYQPTKTFVA